MHFIYNKVFVPIAKSYAKSKTKDEKFKNREFLAKNLLDNYKFKENSNITRIWFHASSMGEFEQARPVIELLKANFPNIYIILTFFSPSGYDNRKNYEYADFITYLPLDFPENVSKFLDTTRPDLAIFIRYDIWFNYLSQLRHRCVPTFLLNASKPQSSLINSYYRSCYRLFNKIFVMNKNDVQYFKSFLPQLKVAYLPDTRFDRIAEKVESSRLSPYIDPSLFADSKVLVAGSTWMPDEDIIIRAFRRYNPNNTKKLSLIIVPHEPRPGHLSELERKWDNYVLLSKINSLSESDWEEIRYGKKIIIVDSIGKLLSLYANAHIAYVGGAFGDGLHSVGEPAGYSLPIITGTNISKSPDASDLLKSGALRTVSNYEEMLDELNKLMNDEAYYAKKSATAGEFVQSRLGSSQIFIDEVKALMKH